ncbi:MULTISPECIES: hypothetical protein [Vibrio]|uniref:Uncharacterized protein n=1 Tax=Vibrio kanaloae TaxID=170673 RepID=A0ABV4LKP8_9VIBR|nr:hypothetical protein [Vibrio kanaloae]OEF14260.1 hypothetical protein A132_10075 [Vibrio kanaloae 5S-149]
MEIEQLETLNNMAITWFTLIFNRKEIKEQKKNRALKALMNSLASTSQYMQVIVENPAEKSRDRERELSDMWSETALLVRPFDEALSERCFFKGVYWINRNRFTEEEIVKKKMKLHHIEMDVSKALKSI